MRDLHKTSKGMLMGDLGEEVYGWSQNVSQPATENPVRTVVEDAIHHLPIASAPSDKSPHQPSRLTKGSCITATM